MRMRCGTTTYTPFMTPTWAELGYASPLDFQRAHYENERIKGRDASKHPYVQAMRETEPEWIEPDIDDILSRY